MILGRLLDGAVRARRRVRDDDRTIAPDGLWPNGLQRERFLPTIALLKQWLDVVEVDAGIDYRLRALEQVETYHVPLGAEADAALARGVRGDARRAGRGPEARDRGPDARRAAARGQRRLVRFRDAVRRPAVAARLPRARPPLSGAVPVRHPADDRRHGRPGAALHLARRHTVRSSREAPGLRRGARRTTSIARGRTAGSSRAP